MSEEKLNPPSRTFSCGGHEIRMCHGLMCDFQRVVPDAATAVDYILNDPYVRDYLVRRALTPSKKSIEKLEDLIDHEEIDLDTDEVLALIEWISEHLLYFFVKSAENLSKVADRLKPQMDPPPQSEDGSEA